MNNKELQGLSQNGIREMYKNYLQEKGMGASTTQTTISDTFYLWNNVGKETFWRVVLSDNFDEEASVELKNALIENSNGDIESLCPGYVSILKKFRKFVIEHSDDMDIVSDEEALKRFLLDIDCLEQLNDWTGKFNLFDVLKITRTEIRHSNMLAWLLNPNENHGLDESVIKGFIQYAITSFSDNEDVFDTLLMDFRSFNVYREWHHIDVLAVSDKEKYILCIENKIDTGEHDNQLSKYQATLNTTYPEYKKAYIFLSPEGIKSSIPETWISMDYSNVVSIIENACKKVSLLPEANILITNYVETIRRNIVGDERLAKICAEIYSKHKRALDLIYENKPDRASDIAEIFRNWGIEKSKKGEIHIDLDKCVKTYTRFTTPTMSEILPDAENAASGWNTKNHYFYEIYNNGGSEFFIQIAFSSKNIPDYLREICDEINKHYPSRQQKENWQWRIPFKTKVSKIDYETSEEKIYELLDKKFEEIRAFEKNLKAKMGK